VKLDDPSCQKGGYESGTRVQEFKTSFTALAGEKESFFDAAILIFSPLAGLRPSRSGEALTLNFPNPAKETSSSLAAALTMLVNMLSRIACACALDMSLASATIVTSSDFEVFVPAPRYGHFPAPAICTRALCNRPVATPFLCRLRATRTSGVKNVGESRRERNGIADREG
jgi:enoyl-CoA hydratase/carnithine racemase